MKWIWDNIPREREREQKWKTDWGQNLENHEGQCCTSKKFKKQRNGTQEKHLCDSRIQKIQIETQNDIKKLKRSKGSMYLIKKLLID